MDQDPASQHSWFWKRRVLCVLPFIGHGCHLDQRNWSVGINAHCKRGGTQFSKNKELLGDLKVIKKKTNEHIPIFVIGTII